MLSRTLPAAFLLAVVAGDGLHVAAQQATNAPDLAETFAIRAVFSQLSTIARPDTLITRLGLRAADEQILRDEVARYRDVEMPLRERSEALARAYASHSREEDQRARLAVEAQRATLRMDTHHLILQRLSDEGRGKWLAAISEARKQLLPPPVADARRAAASMTRAAASTVTGRLRRVTCSQPMVLEIEVEAARVRLILEDPSAVSVLGKIGGAVLLDCGEQDGIIRIGYDPLPDAPDGAAGVVRVLDYRVAGSP